MFCVKFSYAVLALGMKFLKPLIPQGLINNKTYLLNISFKLLAGKNLTF
jgi:hypothetical protein